MDGPVVHSTETAGQLARGAVALLGNDRVAVFTTLMINIAVVMESADGEGNWYAPAACVANHATNA